MQQLSEQNGLVFYFSHSLSRAAWMSVARCPEIGRLSTPVDQLLRSGEAGKIWSLPHDSAKTEITWWSMKTPDLWGWGFLIWVLWNRTPLTHGENSGSLWAWVGKITHTRTHILLVSHWKLAFPSILNVGNKPQWYQHYTGHLCLCDQ